MIRVKVEGIFALELLAHARGDIKIVNRYQAPRLEFGINSNQGVTIG